MDSGAAALVIGGVVVAAAAWLYIDSQNTASTDAGATDLQPRGIRNNNPLNLRYIYLNPWLGQIADDNGLAVYDTPAHGIRAGGKQLDKYFFSDGLQTISGIVSKWAPSNENDVETYISDIETRTGLQRDYGLSWLTDKLPLVMAMIWHENGANPYNADDVAGWLNS